MVKLMNDNVILTKSIDQIRGAWWKLKQEQNSVIFYAVNHTDGVFMIM